MTDSRWYTRRVAAEIGVTPATVTSYKGRKQMPQPDGNEDGKPWWKPETITTWQATRPGKKTRINCPHAKTAETPCIYRDGDTATADDGTCVGCGIHISDLTAESLEDLRRLLGKKGQS